MQITQQHLNDQLQRLVAKRQDVIAQLSRVDGAIVQCSELLAVLATPEPVIYKDGDRVKGPFGEGIIRVPPIAEAEQNAEPLAPKLDEPETETRCPTCDRDVPPYCGHCPPTDAA